MSKVTFKALQGTAGLTDDGLQKVTGGIGVPGGFQPPFLSPIGWSLRNRLKQLKQVKQQRPTSNKYYHVGGGRYAIN